VLAISELGLVQMTRKRTSESLQQKLMDVCPLCYGRGQIKSTVTEVYDLLRDVERHAVQTGETFIRVRARPDLKHALETEEKHLLSHIVKKHKIKISLEAFGVDPERLREAAYEVISSPGEHDQHRTS